MCQLSGGFDRSGFTLLEVMVALALFAGALLGLAQLMAVGARSLQLARMTGLSATLAAQKIEQLRSLAWGYDASGAGRSDVECDAGRWPDAPIGGGGLAPSPPDSLDRNVDGFADYLDESGAWLGSGASPPPATGFVRRWSIAPVGDEPAPAIVIRVVVLRRGGRALPGGGPGGDIEEARMLSVRTRRAW
jgi:prepilin-type N-terminal cleavage/methylation domain-containing protein